jgi:hypothetical protein
MNQEKAKKISQSTIQTPLPFVHRAKVTHLTKMFMDHKCRIQLLIGGMNR